jgi:tetratricopeptide (TPR) repeat protein
MNEVARKQVFVSYAHENLDTVHQVVDGLKKRKLNVWFDITDLELGRWKPQITTAITRSHYFIICISEAALLKTGGEPGFQDEELQTAYEIAQAQPDKEFTIIPIRLEDCGRGDFRLSGWQQYDLFDDFEAGLDRLAVNFGGMSLADAAAKDERTDDEKFIQELFDRGVAAYYAHDFEKAIDFWSSVLELKPDDAWAWYNKGITLGNLGRHEEALAAYDKALELNPDDARAWYNKGAALGNLGRHEEALEALNKALELIPDDARAWTGKCAVLENLGRYEEALEALNKALELKAQS